MAWKNGMFNFNFRDITGIMKEVERWYGVKIIFASPVKGSFSTTLQRDMPVSKLLRNLELTGELKFSIEGKTITVMPVTPNLILEFIQTKNRRPRERYSGNKFELIIVQSARLLIH